jgi:hypothetical protein
MENIDFTKTEICSEIYIGDEAVEILGKYFFGVSTDLPLIIKDNSIISLYEIKVSKRTDGIYKFEFPQNFLPLEEKNPDCKDYIIQLNRKIDGKDISSI